MKADLATSIFTAIAGVVVAYLICNLFLPPLENVTFNILSSSEDYNLIEPNQEVFNYRALNPTVEVYVGECAEYNESGECVDKITSLEAEEENSDDENPVVEEN